MLTVTCTCGVYIADGTVNFQECNIYNNTVARGGGVYVYPNSEVRALNVQLWGNSPDNIAGQGTSLKVEVLSL